MTWIAVVEAGRFSFWMFWSLFFPSSKRVGTLVGESHFENWGKHRNPSTQYVGSLGLQKPQTWLILELFFRKEVSFFFDPVE